jgi:two-component system, cell cycle response regulator
MNPSARILLAHDDHGFGRTLTWILNEHEYEVTPATADEAVMDTLGKDPHDLLVLETTDGPRGLQLLARIKGEARFESLPVLLLSPLPEEEGSVEALGLGAADFLAPPFRARDILARIKARLRAGRELNRARAEARSRAELVEILREIASSLTPDEIYQVLVRRVAQGLGLSKCSILLQGPDEGMATVVAAFENPILRNLRIELHRYPEIERALQTGESVLSHSVQSDPLFAAAREEWRAQGHQVETTSALAIPFLLRGERAGIFFLRTSGEDTPLSELDLQFADQVIKSAVSAIEKAYQLQEVVEGQRELKELAETDPLTGLANRRALEHRLRRELEQAMRYSTVLSCLMVDVDHFKDTNDTYGHQMGDRILAQLAALLKREQRAIDAVARFGGEEFCILLPLTGSGGARILADRILRRVSGYRFGEGEHPLAVTVSIGIATYPDDRVVDGASLLRLADENLLKAKADGRNRYRD